MQQGGLESWLCVMEYVIIYTVHCVFKYAIYCVFICAIKYDLNAYLIALLYTLLNV